MSQDDRVSGIYQIENQLNGKSYLGSTVDVERRWREHLGRLRHRRHPNPHLQAAFDKYGEGAFRFAILEHVEDLLQLAPREQQFLNMLKPEYNIAPIAGSQLGLRHTEEARRKMSEAKRGERNHNYGRHLLAETKRKMADAQRGRQHSEATKRKMSKARRGKPHPHKGHPQSAETRGKIGEAFRGKPLSEEHRRKLSEAQKAYWRRIQGIDYAEA